METRESVQARIALAQPEERTHGLFFWDTLTGFAELFGADVAEQARAAALVPVERGLFTCPIAELLRITDGGASAAERLGLCAYPEALERIGEYLGNSYIRSPVGQAFQRLGAVRMMKSMELSMASTRAVTTYGNRRYEAISPTSARIIFKRELMGPMWIRGIYTRVFKARAMNVTSLSAKVEHCWGPGMDFELTYTWQES